MAPKEIRGRLGSCFQLFFAGGVCVSYWVDYTVESRVPASTRQWQIPIGLQLVPGGILCLGMLLIPESCRWLAKRDRVDEALKSLIWIRGGDSAEVQGEFAEILKGVSEEVRAKENVTWRECLLPANRYRLFLAITIQLNQQLTGNTSLAYYAPQIFKEVGAGTSSLLVTGFFGIIKVVSVGIFITYRYFYVWTFVVESVGRKGAFIGGSIGMGIQFLIIALIVKYNPPRATTTAKISSPGAAAIAMVYLEAAMYNLSWGPVAWLYIGEIFPTRIREFGVATGAASQWLFNFVLSQITPHAIANIGWRTFLMFCIFNWAISVYSWTKGRSLEEMEFVFGSKETAFDAGAIRRKAEENSLEPDHLHESLNKTA
ncbi:MAG: hypothetical protein ASARMPRED_005693 [Alectoria sarmentosa]|nr:MAG: hypothetical protein ASARMPRED_005693 [Alectoria sarmentosa]